jgi:hypothetical protein
MQPYLDRKAVQPVDGQLHAGLTCRAVQLACDGARLLRAPAPLVSLDGEPAGQLAPLVSLLASLVILERTHWWRTESRAFPLGDSISARPVRQATA